MGSDTAVRQEEELLPEMLQSGYENKLYFYFPRWPLCRDLARRDVDYMPNPDQS